MPTGPSCSPADPLRRRPRRPVALARPDGALTDLRFSLNDRVPGSDPSLPYVAYADKGADDEHWTLVIRDVRDGSTVREIPFRGTSTWNGWAAPPVSLSGDHAYIGVDGTLLDVRWRTGQVDETTVPEHRPETHGGREIVSNDTQGRIQVVDLASGAVVKTITYDPSLGFERYPQLSTDGTRLALLPYAMCTEDGSCSYEGKSARIIDLATGRLLVVDGTSVRSCDPDTMACTSTPVTLDGTGPIRVSGNNNES